MGVLWSRLSTDGYYGSLDKQLGSIKQNISSLQAGKRRREQAWAHVRARFAAGFFAVYIVILAYAAYVTQQPAGAYSTTAHAKRVAPVFLAPAMAWLVYSVADYLRAVLDRRATAQIEKLQAKLRKMVAELKDSTRYQRTHALLEKYDPDRPPPPPPVPSKKQQQQQQQRRKTSGGNANRAANVAATAVTGAGMALSSALGQIFSTAAGTLIADEPMMVAMLKDAQSKAQELERENEELRRMLGMPPELILGGRGNNSNNNNFSMPPPNLVVGGGGENEMIEENLGGFGSPLPLSGEENVDATALESPRVLSPLEKEIGQPAAAVVEEELSLNRD